MIKLFSLLLLCCFAITANAAGVYKQPPYKVTYVDDQGVNFTVVNALAVWITPYGTSRTIHVTITNRNLVGFTPSVAAKVPYSTIDPILGVTVEYHDSPDFVAVGCDVLVLPGQSCTADVTYTPIVPEVIDGTVSKVTEAFLITLPNGSKKSYVLDGYAQ